jgi:hypothetical protein
MLCTGQCCPASMKALAPELEEAKVKKEEVSWWRLIDFNPNNVPEVEVARPFLMEEFVEKLEEDGFVAVRF